MTPGPRVEHTGMTGTKRHSNHPPLSSPVPSHGGTVAPLDSFDRWPLPWAQRGRKKAQPRRTLAQARSGVSLEHRVLIMISRLLGSPASTRTRTQATLRLLLLFG